MTTDILERFSRDAGLFPHHLDIPSDQLLLTHLDEQTYREVSFLDQRIITPTLQREIAAWSDLSGFSANGQRQPDYIFHIGHVGSTLISRLLGELDDVLALREPAILRQLSDIKLQHVDHNWTTEQFRQRLSETVGWLSRTFHTNQRVNIKASSFVSPLATQLLQNADNALFLFTPLELYLQTILAGEASVQEAQHLAPQRLKRLTEHLGQDFVDLVRLSLVQTVALGWLCEMVTLDQAARSLPETEIIWMDFDVFLQQPSKRLTQIAEHFGYSIEPEQVDQLVAGPIMNSYSKAPEYDYSADLRRQLLAQAAQEHSEQIRKTVLWVTETARKYPKIGDAIARSEMRN